MLQSSNSQQKKFMCAENRNMSNTRITEITIIYNHMKIAQEKDPIYTMIRKISNHIVGTLSHNLYFLLKHLKSDGVPLVEFGGFPLCIFRSNTFNSNNLGDKIID